MELIQGKGRRNPQNGTHGKMNTSILPAQDNASFAARYRASESPALRDGNSSEAPGTPASTASLYPVSRRRHGTTPANES